MEFVDRSPRELAISEFSRKFGAEQVIVLGKGQYTTHLFHLDQSFIIINPGEVVIMDLSRVTDQEIKNIAEDFENMYGMSQEEWMQEFFPGEATYLLEHDYLADRNEISYIINQSRIILEEINTAFTKLGYTIHRYPLDLWQNLHYQSYANSIVFTDKETGKRKILMPVFPDLTGNYDVNYTPNQQAQEFYQGLGLEVIPVNNYTWYGGGNNNCLINVYK